MIHPGKPPRTHIHQHRDMTDRARRHFRSGVSIHSHTHFSKENLGFIPHYASRIPWVAGRVKRSCAVYRSRTGMDLDFKRAYWTPPLSPQEVWSSEVRQIEDQLGMSALVSITDHDCIEAPQSMSHTLPMSMEWTVPYGSRDFHLGLHNFDAGLDGEMVRELQRFTAGYSEYSSCELLSRLHDSPKTLIVINHPLWDFERSGNEAHRIALQAFLAEHHEFIHALEINGFRPWPENLEVYNLGESWAMPVVAGGDRHGTAPNTVLNLTEARTIEEFAMSIREDRVSEVVLMPEYGDSMFTKQLRTAGDAVQHYPGHHPDRRQWTDRVFFEQEAEHVQPLSKYLPAGAPTWLALVVVAIRALGSSSLHRIMNAAALSSTLAMPYCGSRRASSGSAQEPEKSASCPIAPYLLERARDHESFSIRR